MDVAHLSGMDPLRPVDWRLQLASDRVERGLQVSRTFLDDATFRLADYLRRRQNSRTTTARRSLAQRFPDLHTALEIFESARGTRFLIEARILAGSTVGAISQRTGILEGAVRWYALVFFDVWDRLNCEDFVVDCVIGTAQSATYEWRDLGWKTIAYHGGADALNELVFLERRIGLDRLLHGLKLETRVALAQKTLAAAQNLNSADPSTALGLMKLNGAGRGKQGSEEESTDSIQDNLYELLKSVQFHSVGPADSLPEYETGALELRPEELFRLAIGEEPRDYDEWKNAKYPTPNSG